ncbi:MAG: hypothetical protein HYV09_15780 [Deltaproteobacteria bacterium]|nr:hypothetical protein [Deltaproteobacteria bacterium]
MTKAMRWGVSSLMIIGGISLGAFAGCSDDEEPGPAPTDQDTGVPDTGIVDTGVPDTGATPTDTGTDTPDTPDTGPKPADRAVTLAFAAPDMPGRFVCIGAFASTADVTTSDPASALPSTGALGIPDPSAPEDATKTTAFNYGAVVPVPLNDTAIAALKVFKVVLYLLDENPAKLATPSDCAKEWKNVRSDTKRWRAVDPGTVAAGDSALVSFIGCQGAPDATGTCGTAGNNFEIRIDKLATAKPATGNIGFQFLHLSQFPGSTASGAPSWQGVDIYLMPMKKPATTDGGVTDAVADVLGETGAPALTFEKIADNVKYKDITTSVTGVTLPADVDPEGSYLVVAPRVVSGASVKCSNADGRPSTTCPNYTLPLRPFLNPTAGYPRVGGGFFTNTNQVIALVGSGVPPTLGDGGAGTPSLRIPFIRASKWP